MTRPHPYTLLSTCWYRCYRVIVLAPISPVPYVRLFFFYCLDPPPPPLSMALVSLFLLFTTFFSMSLFLTCLAVLLETSTRTSAPRVPLRSPTHPPLQGCAYYDPPLPHGVSSPMFHSDSPPYHSLRPLPLLNKINTDGLPPFPPPQHLICTPAIVFLSTHPPFRLFVWVDMLAVIVGCVGFLILHAVRREPVGKGYYPCYWTMGPDVFEWATELSPFSWPCFFSPSVLLRFTLKFFHPLSFTVKVPSPMSTDRTRQNFRLLLLCGVVVLFHSLLEFPLPMSLGTPSFFFSLSQVGSG